MSEEDQKVVEAMIQYGGSFVKALGEAALHADMYNLGKIKQTWKEYWATYQEMVNKK